jgi:hypothetical protein
MFSTATSWAQAESDRISRGSNSLGIAPAQPDLSGTIRVLYVAGGLLSLLPAGIGFDTSVGPSATEGLRLLLTWPVQIPLPIAERGRRTAALSNHRVVLTPGISIRPEQTTYAGVRWDVSFNARVGYRVVYHPRGRWLGVLLGLGTVVEFSPWVRPGASPELGLHVGDCCTEASAIVTLILRADLFLPGDNGVRMGASLGWAFY